MQRSIFPREAAKALGRGQEGELRIRRLVDWAGRVVILGAVLGTIQEEGREEGVGGKEPYGDAEERTLREALGKKPVSPSRKDAAKHAAERSQQPSRSRSRPG